MRIELTFLLSAFIFSSSQCSAKLKGIRSHTILSIKDRKLHSDDEKKHKKDEPKKILKTSKVQIEENFFCPAERYIEWSQLPDKVEPEYIVASKFELHYDEQYWNHFSSPVEDMSWDTLFDDMITAGTTMGYNEDRWDCCLNHYENFDYDELLAEDWPELQAAYKILGWDKDIWNVEDLPEHDQPKSEDKNWDELNLLEQQAADFLCYNEESWNEEALPWSSRKPISPPAEMNFTCPATRYKAWSVLETPEKYAAIDLGYDEESWNFYLNPIEEYSYEEITAERDWREAMLDLGYHDESSWDCCVNNYRSYDYYSMSPEVAEYPFLQYVLNVLGWDEESWASNDPDDWPESEDKSWDELTDFEQAAADYLCYYEESWNQVYSIEELEEEFEKDENEEGTQ